MSAPRPSAEPHIALVVCTRDRAARLEACLASVRRIRSRVPWELVVVDNGSRDGTPALLEAFAAGDPPCQVTVVREPRPGLARARNAGVVASRAPLLVFTDDDCYPEPDLLDRYADIFADPRVGFAAGRVLLHDPDDYPITIRTDEFPYPIPTGGWIFPGTLHGANMALRREVIHAIGGFDPALGPGAPFNFEDLDITARASWAGHVGGYHPEPVVRHHHRRRDPAVIAALLRSYAHGRGAYFASVLLRGRGRRRQAVREVLRLWWGRLRGGEVRDVLREVGGAVHYLAHVLRRPPERPLADGAPFRAQPPARATAEPYGAGA